jgi:biopolymer transport protein ExbD
MAEAASGRSSRRRKTEELDLLPVMNLFCCMIPFLLLSASFLQVTIITMSQTEGIGASGSGAVANLSRSEEDRLQPKIIMTDQEMFIGTVAGTAHVCYATTMDLRGEQVITFDFDSLQTRAHEVYVLLSESYPQIEFHKVVILTVETTRYENIVKAIDACAAAGFDQPGLQVAPTSAVERATEAAMGRS